MADVTRRIVVIGAGIVGCALAANLSEIDGVTVTVLERGPRDRLVGSTGHAPGFVGLLSEHPVATELAIMSAECYEGIGHGGRSGFDRVGGLEVATSPGAMADLERRAARGGEAGLPARVLDAAQTAAAAPMLVGPRRCCGGVIYPRDGTARSDVISVALRDRAERSGARFSYGAASRRSVCGASESRPSAQPLKTSPLTMSSWPVGSWGPAVLALAGQRLPLTPVAHPYVYGPGRHRAATAAPLLRWPEHHVYARDHGQRLGLGSYDHQPLPVRAEDLGAGAEQPWAAELFDPAISLAQDLLPPAARFQPDQRLNGVFAMTADNLPIVGPVDEVGGGWVAEALWVTHAWGAARALVGEMTGARPVVDGWAAPRPSRFTGKPVDLLTAHALRLYRDIYATA